MVTMCSVKWFGSPWRVFSRLWSHKSSGVLAANRSYQWFVHLGWVCFVYLQCNKYLLYCKIWDSKAETHLHNHIPTALHRASASTLPSQSVHVPAWRCSENPQAELPFFYRETKKNCWDNTQKLKKDNKGACFCVRGSSSVQQKGKWTAASATSCLGSNPEN